MLTVLLWYWRGWRPVYTPKHVHIVAQLLRKCLPDGSRILCVTDLPLGECCHAQLDGTLPLPRDPFAGQKPRSSITPMFSWVRMHQCDAAWLGQHGIDGPVMSVDLDSVPLRDLSPIVSPPATVQWMALRSAAARLNPSLLWQREPGVLQGAWDTMTLENVRRIPSHIIGSDQAWLSWWRASSKVSAPLLLDRSHGVYQYAVKLCTHSRTPCLPRLYTFAGSRKQWDKAARFGPSSKAYAAWRDAAKLCTWRV